MDETSFKLSPEEIAQAVPVSAGPIKLTPEEISSAQPATGGVDAIKEFSTEQLAALPGLTEIFANRPDLQADPAIVQKVQDARHMSRQTGFWEGLGAKYQGQDAIDTNINVTKDVARVIWDTAKGFGKGAWNYANALATPFLAGAAAPFSTPMATELLDEGQRRFAEGFASTESGATVTGQTAKAVGGFLARKAHLAKPLNQWTEEDKANDLWDAVAMHKQQAQIQRGHGAVMEAVGGEVVKELEAAGRPVRPEEVSELAAGEPFSWYAMGKGFQGVTKLVPRPVSALAEKAAGIAGEAAAKVTGTVIEKGADLTKLGATAVEKVAPAASAAFGVVKGFEHGGIGGAITGAGLGYKAGQGVAEGLKKATPIIEGVSQFGEQVSGAKPIISPGAQLVQDLVSGAPGGALEVAKGASFDLGLAAATSEETPEDRTGVGLGTVFGALGAAKRIGGKVLSGQIIGPRAYGLTKPTPSSGQFKSMDVAHTAFTSAAPPGAVARINAVRAFAKGIGIDDVYAAKDAASMEAALKGAGVDDASAKLLSEQDGFFTASIKGRKVVGIVNPESAPHEVFHGFQAVIGESANRVLDGIVQKSFAPVWDREGFRYAQDLARSVGKTITPDEWRETVLDVSGWGKDDAAEKIHQTIFNKLSAETGAVPDEGAVKQLAAGEWSRLLADAAKRNPGKSLAEVQKGMWRDVLSPAEAKESSDRYLARELAAENFAEVFKHTGPTLEDPKGLLPRFARVVANVVSFMGGEPLAGRVSAIAGQPLSFEVTEAARKAAKSISPIIQGKPEIVPEGTKQTISGLPNTPEAQQAAAVEAKAAADEAPDVKPTPTAKMPNPQSPREVLGTIAEAIANRNGVKINYHSAPDEPAAATTSNRTARRALIEIFRTMPQAARALWEKTFFPERVLKTKKGFQVLGWAPEVFASNAHKVAQALTEIQQKAPGSFTSPYELDPKTGTFTEAGWKALYEDVQTFVQNQIGGRTGAGENLKVPEGLGAYAPPVQGTAMPLDQGKADFINLLFNFRLPDTARITGGKVPLNIVGQEVSAATKPGRVEIPIRPRPSFGGEAAEKLGIEGRPILEVNPTRNALEKAAQDAGVALPSMLEAVQRLNVENIADVQHAPEAPEFRGNTLTLTAGFQPSSNPRAIKEAAVIDDEGKTWTGYGHWNAIEKGEGAGATFNTMTAEREGFITNDGEFLGRDDAAKRAFELKQIKEERGFPGLESTEFEAARQFQPSGAAAMDKLKKMSPDELKNYKGRLANGGTGWAFDTGAAAKSEEDLQAFKHAREVFDGLRKDAMAQKDYAKAIDFGTRAQFAREAFEAASGKQIDDPTQDASNFGLPADYAPPVKLQAQPKKQEDLSGREFWLGRSGNLINARGSHYEAASRELEKAGVEVPSFPHDAYGEMYKLGYARLVRYGNELMVNGPDLTPSQTRKLNEIAADHDVNVTKEGRPVADELSAQQFQPKEEKRTGLAFKDFFSDVARGRFGKSNVPFEPETDISDVQYIADERSKHLGNFEDHIQKSIPTIYEEKLRSVKGVLGALAGKEDATLLDIGSSEGDYGKTISALSGGKIKTVSLDPNPEMAKDFHEISQVPGATQTEDSFGFPFEDQGRTYPRHEGGPYDVINEAVAFQFIDPDRAGQLAEVKRLLKPDGLFLTVEKLKNPNWAENEKFKDENFKDKYFTKEDLKAKEAKVGFVQSKAESKAVGMVDNMVSQDQFEAELKKQFQHVVQYWDSGNFKGYAASDNPNIVQKFVDETGDHNSKFSTVQTPREVTGQFQPATAAGRALEEKGYRIERTEPDSATGMKSYMVLNPEGEVVSELSTYQVSPTKAMVELVTTNQAERRKGLAETLYRELATDLQKAGITKLGGYVVDQGAAKLRNKIFGTEIPSRVSEHLVPGSLTSEIPADVQFQPSRDYDASEDFFTRVNNHRSQIVHEFLGLPKDSNKEVSWSRIPASRLKKIWLDYGKTGVLRDEKGMDKIADQALDNISRIKAVTELAGHESYDVWPILEQEGIYLSEAEKNRFYDSPFITNQFSDYAMAPLEKLYNQLYKAETPEEKLHVVDRILNVVHQRGDIADLFVEGGTKTLNEIASQGGYSEGAAWNEGARGQFSLQPKKEDWKLKSGAAGFSKAWILPDGTPIQLGGQWHHDYLNENPDLRTKYGLKESDDADVARAGALKKGFARINYDVRNGKLTVEARDADWPEISPAIRTLIEQNLGKIDRVQTYLYDKGVKQIVDSGAATLFDKPKEERLAAVPFLTAPGDVTETSPQATPGVLQFQPPPPKELKKIRTGESGGQTFTPDGKIWDPKGASVDIVSLASVNVPRDELTPAAVNRALKPYASLLRRPGLVTGVFAFDNQGEPTVSIDVNVVVPQEFRDNTLAFAKANGQDSIWDAKENKVISAGGPGEAVLKDPADLLTAAQSLVAGKPYDFSGKRKPLENVQIAQMSNEELADYFPESVIPKKRDEYIPSKILDSPLAKKAGSENKAVEVFSDKLVDFANQYKDNPIFQQGAKWYSEFSKQLHEQFGDQAGIFAELLAATSPQTSVATNFHYAVEALQSLKAGRFAKILPKFEEGLRMIDEGTWEPWYQKEVKAGRVEKPPVKPTAATFLAQWIETYGLRPMQTNGKQFGMHSARVLQVLARRWAAMNTGPKTKTFVSNLIGSAHDATIDIWADRTMRRLGYEGFQERWRILPLNAAPVSEADFAFSQKAFAAAADKLGMTPDALQGALWYAEKQLWSDRGWGKLDLGSFMNELPKVPTMRESFKQRLETPTGQLIEPRKLQ